MVVNVSSVQGRVATPLEGPYSGTKHALEAISETMHYELGHFGIRVVIVQPGYIAPGMKQADGVPGGSAYRELWEQWEGTDKKVTGPNGRPGPELVARGHPPAPSRTRPRHCGCRSGTTQSPCWPPGPSSTTPPSSPPCARPWT